MTSGLEFVNTHSREWQIPEKRLFERETGILIRPDGISSLTGVEPSFDTASISAFTQPSFLRRRELQYIIGLLSLGVFRLLGAVLFI